MVVVVVVVVVVVGGVGGRRRSGGVRNSSTASAIASVERAFVHIPCLPGDVCTRTTSSVCWSLLVLRSVLPWLGPA